MTDTRLIRTQLSTPLWTSPAPESPGKYSRAHQPWGEGWPLLGSPKGDLHVLRTSRTPCCPQRMGQRGAVSPMVPALPLPDMFSLLAPFNQNKAFCVCLILLPIRVWKFSCGFPSGLLSLFWTSEMTQMKQLAAWRRQQPWPSRLFPSQCNRWWLHGVRETQWQLRLPRQCWHSHFSFQDLGMTKR